MPNCSDRVRARQQIMLGVLAMALWSARAEGQAQTGVEVAVHGSILTTAFRNSGRVNNADVPTVALAGAGQSAFGAAIRQTRIGVTASHPSVLGGRLFAELDADFFGGQFGSGGGRTHPVLRIRRGYGEIRWSGVALLVGQESPSVFGVSPRSVAAVGFPQLASAGNLWLWLPQARLTVETGPADRARVGMEVSLLAPNAGDPVDPFLTQPDLAEQSGRPGLEMRGVVRWRAGGREGEIGVGGHLGWVGPDSARRTSKALGGSAVVPVGPRWEVRAEAFSGQALAGLGGGGIGQNLAGGRPVKTSGGWFQAVFLPGGGVEIGLSFGTDNPDDDTIAAGGRTNNEAVAGSVTWRRAPVVAGLEYRRLTTSMSNPALLARAHHLALALGVEF